MDCTIHVAKTKALISFAVTAKLICVIVFAYAKIWFFHDEAHIFSCHVRYSEIYKVDACRCYINISENMHTVVAVVMDFYGNSRLLFISDHLSRVMRKPYFCKCENKDADQLDQRLCFHYMDSAIPLLLKSEISRL